MAILAAAAAGGLLAWKYLYKPARSAIAPPGAGAAGTAQRQAGAVAVEAVPVKRTTLRDLETFSGSLLPRSQFQVSNRIAGRLERVLVDVGDRVTKDQLLAVLDGEEYQQQVDQARAELEVAQANLDSARVSLESSIRDFERVKVLWEKKISSESELDQADAQRRKAEAQHTVAQAQVRQKEAALKTAELRLSQTEVRASGQGGSGLRVVGERFTDPGSLLKANDPILSILEIGTLVAVIQVTERSYSKVRTGQSAEVSVEALPGRRFSGKVTRIAPFLRESTRQAEIRVEVSNPETVLKPGMPALVTLEYGRRPNVPAIPVSALTTRNERQGVFLIQGDGKTVRFVPVTTGVSEEPWVEILKPPLEGMVVTLGQHLLEDGASVTVSRGNNAANKP